MKIFAIADLHMDGGAGKPMDVFGPNWAGHCGRIFGSWQSCVLDEDAVLVPGDISWAMRFSDALLDLSMIAELPGRKVLLRGNHDFWWSSPTRMREALPEGMSIIQNDAVDLGPAVVCGSRGWILPADDGFSADDRKIYERELLRLELSLTAADRLAGGEKPVIAMMHFPPVLKDGERTGFSIKLAEHGVRVCVYGHLHGQNAWGAGFTGELDGVRYGLCSADSLGFAPLLVESFGNDGGEVEKDGPSRS